MFGLRYKIKFSVLVTFRPIPRRSCVHKRTYEHREPPCLNQNQCTSLTIYKPTQTDYLSRHKENSNRFRGYLVLTYFSARKCKPVLLHVIDVMACKCLSQINKKKLNCLVTGRAESRCNSRCICNVKN